MVTTPGATEAVTPKQRARDLCYEAWEKNWHFHQLEPTIAAALREAEANALRRALAICENYKARMDIAAGKPHPMTGERNGIAICKADAANSLIESIRSLLPKEEGK